MEGLKRGEIACRKGQVQKSVSFRISLMKGGCLFDCVFLFKNFVGFWVETFSRFPVELSPERFRIATSEIGGSELVSEGQSPPFSEDVPLATMFFFFRKLVAQ